MSNFLFVMVGVPIKYVFFSSDKINRNGKDSAYFHILRFDTQNRIIAGTFKFSLFNKQGTQRLHVTDGRFDWHY
jgi:hypothetical protein